MNAHRADNVFDMASLKKPRLTDQQRLDFLDRFANGKRIVCQRSKPVGWELFSTPSQTIGFIGVREAIDRMAQSMGYTPPPEFPTYHAMETQRKATLITFCILALIVLVGWVAL